MLKGYVQATLENIKKGQKCYIKSTGTRTDIHNLVHNTFGTIVGNYGEDGTKSVVDVKGTWIHAWELNDFEPLD